MSVSDLAAWQVHDPKKPIGELVEYDKVDECVRILGAVISNARLSKYDRYTMTFQYRRRTEAAWCNFVLQPNCAVMFGSPSGTGLLGASGHHFLPLAGQNMTEEGEATLLSPMKEAEKPLGEWNDVQVKIDLKRWLVTLNGRTIHEAECSVFTPSPFWVQGGAGFEFRSIEVVPLSQ